MLIGLNKFCSSASGVAVVEYLPTDKIDEEAYERLSNEGIFTGNIANTNAFFYAPLIPIGKGFTMDSDDSEQGEYYNFSVVGILQGDTADILAELNRTLQRRYILRITDGDGQRRLIGTLDEPFKFSFALSKSEPGQNNNYRVKWTCNTANPFYFENFS